MENIIFDSKKFHYHSLNYIDSEIRPYYYGPITLFSAYVTKKQPQANRQEKRPYFFLFQNQFNFLVP